ncbi:type II toxin-antitoxin system RelE family toxin, partial [Gordonia sp. DT219]|uniref:type II toxin-antitoxin system RelE family toxin n=1 Tax=Gordonia sp. DT219 TaxID=3416658 RepID=UPI003CEF42A0
MLDAIDSLASDPRPSGCIQLKGGGGEFRIRVGDYRIIYDIQDDELVVLVDLLTFLWVVYSHGNSGQAPPRVSSA